jgi:hypothetical protein
VASDWRRGRRRIVRFVIFRLACTTVFFYGAFPESVFLSEFCDVDSASIQAHRRWGIAQLIADPVLLSCGALILHVVIISVAGGIIILPKRVTSWAIVILPNSIGVACPAF